MRRKVRGLLTENQMRAPARRGIVAVTVFPGAPRGMETFSVRAEPVDDGELG